MRNKGTDASEATAGSGDGSVPFFRHITRNFKRNEVLGHRNGLDAGELRFEDGLSILK